MSGRKLVFVGGIFALGLILQGCPEARTHEEGAEETSEETTEEKETTQESTEQAPAEAEGKDTKPPAEEELSGTVVDGVREVKVEASQWKFNPARIIVRKGEKVRLLVKSKDVTHGLQIKQFKINRRLPPRKEQEIEFTADSAGEFRFQCSVFCGSGHGKMAGKLIVRE